MLVFLTCSLLQIVILVLAQCAIEGNQLLPAQNQNVRCNGTNESAIVRDKQDG